MPALFTFLFALTAGLADAASLPDLKKQRAWGDGEKQQLLQYLNSGSKPKISGTVKGGEVKPATEEARRPWYVNVSAVTDTVFTVGGGDALSRESTAVGPRLIVGGHLFSWVRLYGGAQYTRFRMRKLDDTRDLVNHLQIPIGVELALVPLGTPQTRYIVLRGGYSWHQFSSKTPRELKRPLDGWNGSWNLGLGYEWQIPETKWRVNALFEGYSSLLRQNNTVRFYGVGASIGAVWAF